MFWAGAAPDVGPHIGRWVAGRQKEVEALRLISLLSSQNIRQGKPAKTTFFRGEKEKGSNSLGSVASFFSKHPARHMLVESVEHRFRFPSWREIHYIALLIISRECIPYNEKQCKAHFLPFETNLLLNSCGFRVYSLLHFVTGLLGQNMDFGGKLPNCGQLCFAEDAEGVRSARLTMRWCHDGDNDHDCDDDDDAVTCLSWGSGKSARFAIETSKEATETRLWAETCSLMSKPW